MTPVAADADRLDRALAAYADCYVSLTPETVGDLRALVTPDVHFRDPFNDVRGADHVVRIMAAMFEDADDVRFEMLERFRTGDRAVLLWRFWFRPKRLKLPEPWVVDGTSVLRLTPDGLVAEHLDHWDAAGQFYERLPLLGSLIRLVKRRLKVD